MDKQKTDLKRRVGEASALFKSGKLDKSLNLCYQILEEHPQQGQTLQLIGVININQGKYVKAIDHLKRSLAELDHDAIAHHNLASAYNLVGKFDKAEQSYRKAIELNPDYAEAYFNLAMITDIDQHLNIIKQIQRLLANSHLGQHESVLLHFAAGKYFHHVKEYQRAFSQLESANKAQIFKFDPQQHHQQTKAIIHTFTKKMLDLFEDEGNQNKSVLFLIGMPACGTNILETALRKHPQIESIENNTDFLVLAHELSRIRPGSLPYPECVGLLAPNAIQRCANVYLEHTPQNPEHHYILNSFPLNFNYLGLIKLLFPKARFIHCQRSPLDSCLAGYFNLLHNHYHFTHDLDHITQYYLDYLKLMQHWQELFPKDILTVQYEGLTKYPGKTINKILKFLDLAETPAITDQINLKQRYHFEVNFGKHYLRQVEMMENRLKPYMKTYPTLK